MFTWGERVVLIVVAVLLVVVASGSHCNTRSTLQVVRQVHVGVRQAGTIADEQISTRLEQASDICLQRAEEAGHPAGSGQEGFDYWRDCMNVWNNLRVAVNEFCNSLEELENIYQDIEAGTRGQDDWEYWARRVLDHGRTVLRFVRELDVGIDSETLASLQEQLDGLCRLLHCDEEAVQ